VNKSPAVGRREKLRYVLDLSGFQKDEKGEYLLRGTAVLMVPGISLNDGLDRLDSPSLSPS